MKRSILVALAALTLGGCATVPKTTTYQTTEWREVEEAQPATTIIIEEQEIKQDPQPSKIVVVQADIPRTFPGAKKGRKYLNIGYKPVNPNRALVGEEVEFILPADAYVKTIDRDQKRSEGWLLAGKRIIGVPTDDPNYYKAIWIRECGNDLFNEDKIAILIRVRKELVAQPPIRTRQPAKISREVVQQPPVKRWVPVTVEHTRTLTCRERKAEVSWVRKGLSYVVTGIGGVGGALLGGQVGGAHGVQIGAGLGVLAGRLVGGYTDGSECIDGADVAEGVVLGVAAGFIAPAKASGAAAGSTPGHTLPGNGGGNTLPGNGGGYAPPVNPVTGHTLPFN